MNTITLVSHRPGKVSLLVSTLPNTAQYVRRQIFLVPGADEVVPNTFRMQRKVCRNRFSASLRARSLEAAISPQVPKHKFLEVPGKFADELQIRVFRRDGNRPERNKNSVERLVTTIMSSTHVDDDDSQFGLANIPFGVVSTQDDSTPKAATRLFGQVFRIPDLISKGLMNSLDEGTMSALLKVRTPCTT